MRRKAADLPSAEDIGDEFVWNGDLLRSRCRVFGGCLERDVVELVFGQDALISRRVDRGEKDPLGQDIEFHAVQRVWIWLFQPCTMNGVDKSNG